MADPRDDADKLGKASDSANPFAPGADVPAQPDAADSHNRRLTMYGIMGGVALFAVVVAGGVYRQTGKLLAIPILLGTVGAFLLIWFVAWRLRVVTKEDEESDAE